MRAFIAALCVSVGCAGAAAQPITSHAYQVAHDYSWGYRCAIKQPLGSYSLGRSVYNISRRTQGTDGSPDQLAWVEEATGRAEIIDIGRFDGAVENPGGMADFGDDGRI